MSNRVLCCALLAASLAGAQDVKPIGLYIPHAYSGPDSLEWERVKNSGDVQMIQSFVSRYPASRYLKAAERRLEHMQVNVEYATGGERRLVQEQKYVVRAVPLVD